MRKTANNHIKKVGSVCSGIEAASVAWSPLGYQFSWFSEIADFPSSVLSAHYPNTPNLGDMTTIPEGLLTGKVPSVDLVCGGTPCQAFSFAGWREGLNDERGNLALKFADIVESNDAIRVSNHQQCALVFWENVEGVLTDKTNAFGCLVSFLAGLDSPIQEKRWPGAGVIRGPKRNVAWRLLDAKYFGVPQQRRRVYLLAGGKDFSPENVLFEENIGTVAKFPKQKLTFEKQGHQFEVFREYTDCLYAAYGTKWNGNAAANNGSLFVVQDGDIRRFSPLESERLMGFPDNYTDIEGASNTRRYMATGNSWAVPVIRWIGERIEDGYLPSALQKCSLDIVECKKTIEGGEAFFFDKEYINSPYRSLNVGGSPNELIDSSLEEIVSPYMGREIFISPVGCYGILRRKSERNLSINHRLEAVLIDISSRMSAEEIEGRSRIQKRGPYRSKKRLPKS